jgi:hypothetical protein
MTIYRFPCKLFGDFFLLVLLAANLRVTVLRTQTNRPRISSNEPRFLRLITYRRSPLTSVTKI